MTFTHRLLRTVLPMVATLASPQAQAVYLSGSFSGTAQAETLPLNFPPRGRVFL